MSSKPWIAWYPADYRRKTAGLTFEQSEAYRRLLEAYYENSGGLTNDKASLYRTCSAMTESERAAIDHAINAFFSFSNGHLVNSRADEEIAKQQAIHDKLSAAGKRGGHIGGKARPKHTHIHIPQAQDSNVDPSISKILPLPESDFVELIPLLGKKEYAVHREYLNELERAYPAVDGPATLREIRAWCLSNEPKLKTARGIKRFLNSWFRRIQDNG